jgi:hypothetical protein
MQWQEVQDQEVQELSPKQQREQCQTSQDLQPQQ